MRRLESKIVLAVFMSLFLTFGALGVSAQAGDYPDKPITMIDPWPPGGGADLIGRVAASVSTEYMGQPLIMKYVAGAAGLRGAEAVSRSDADGYTIGLIGQGAIANQTVTMGDKATFKKDDFIFLCQMTANPCLLVANAKAPFKTLPEMIEYVNAHPGEVVFSSSGRFGFVHTAYARLMEAADIRGKMTHLPTSGGAAATKECLGGRSMVTGNPPGVLSAHIEAGTLIPLAICDTKRAAAFPNVPTVKEALGVDVTPTEFWVSPAVPKGTPPERVQFLREQFAKICTDKSVVKMAERMDNPINYVSGEDFQKKWDNEWVEAARLADVFMDK